MPLRIDNPAGDGLGDSIQDRALEAVLKLLQRRLLRCAAGIGRARILVVVLDLGLVQQEISVQGIPAEGGVDGLVNDIAGARCIGMPRR